MPEKALDTEEQDALSERLRTDYGWRMPISIALIQDGQAGNRTYRVSSEINGGAILRVYGPSWRGREERIRFELDLLRHLDKRGVPVACPIPRQSGDTLGEVTLDGDSRPCALFTLAPGTGSWPIPPSNARRLGATMAALHLAASDFPAPGDTARYGTEQIVDIPLQRMLPYVEGRQDALFLTQLAERMRTLISGIPGTRDAFGIIHGDMHQGNCHFTPEGAVTLFDFSLCGVGWRGFDITGVLWPMRDEHYQQEPIRLCCDAYLSGYRSVRPLPPGELAALPAFVKARDFWETDNWMELAPETPASVFAEGMRILIARFRTFPLPYP